MSANLENKKAVVEEIKSKIQNAKAVVFVDYKGTNVSQDTAMRKAMREAGNEYKVYKNRLMLRALNELGITGFDEELNNTTAVAISSSDEVAPARIIAEAAKTNENLKVKCGILNGEKIDAEYVNKLASIPSKDVLIAQLLGMIQAPIRGLAVALSEIAKKGE